MARVCTVCSHPDRPAIDMAIVNRRPYRDLARTFSVGRMALLNHHDAHLPAELAKARAAADVADADSLLAQLGALRSKAMSLLLKAEASGDLRTALLGVREARGCIELLAEMEQRIDRRPVVNILLTPEWARVRAVVLDVLRDDPERRTALAARLVALGASA